MCTPSLHDEIHDALQGAPFELTEKGLFCLRTTVPAGSLPLAEAALERHGPVRVLDFTHGADRLAENVVPRDGADPAAYEGVARPSGHRLFRVDHHYDVPSLARVSTTPLVLHWVRGLWRCDCREVLAEVARSRYLADHADTDILLSNFLAGQAENEALVHGPLGAWLAAAALRNDYVDLPAAALEPQASQAFYACLGIEAEVLAGRLRFADAQERILPQLLPWLAGDRAQLDPQEGQRLDGWSAEMRAKEQRTLERIACWEREGKLTRELDGRLAILEADEKIDNSDFYLYLARREPPVVQLLSFPFAGSKSAQQMVKVRAHGDANLYTLYPKLNAITPNAKFDGRRAAGGSKPFGGMARADLIEAVRAWLSEGAG